MVPTLVLLLFLQVLITLIVMWITCVIFTVLNVFSDDPQDTSYMARTDVRNGLIRETPWVLLPYPGKISILLQN